MGGADDKDDKANSPPDSAGTPDPAAEADKNTMDKDTTDEMDMDEARPEATLTYKVRYTESQVKKQKRRV